MNRNDKVFCVISHTHWDREWYAPLEVFRHRLVDLFDSLLAILKEYPNYVFHMDAQTVVLEDYLEVRPSKREELKHYIQSGNIMVGPWYLQNDFYLTSGEATIRNLLEGDKLCQEFGGKGKIGYAPDQFGNISQLPQILRNFGYDNFVFGRGFSEYSLGENQELCRKPSPTEFIWKGPDGSEVLAIHMRHWYNNAQRFSADIEMSYRFLKSIENNYDNEFTFTPYYLLMNGVDHLQPQENLLPILEQLQTKLEGNQTICQYNFDDYLEKVKSYIKENDVELPVYEGELRKGHDFDLLKGTLSSRHYLKIMNVQAQSLLENRLEPLYAMLERNGMQGVASVDRFRYLWKNLMRNHPHDSICGCSRDEVHSHMENRYNEFFEFANEYLKRGMQLAADHTAACRKGKGDEYVLTVFNTLAFPIEQAVRVSLSFLAADGLENFEIIDQNGLAIPFAIFEKHYEELDVHSPINLPGVLDVVRYEGYADVGRVEPYAMKTFTIRKKEGVCKFVPWMNSENEFCLKNEFFQLSVTPKGQVDVTWENHTAKNCLYLEDLADIGTSYVYMKGTDIPIYSHDYVSSVSWVENHPYCQSVDITYDLPLPVSYDKQQGKRTDEVENTRVVLTVSVKPKQPYAQVDYHIENRSRWHRLRVVVNTGVANTLSTADIPFDVVTHGEEAHCIVTESKVLPNTSFAYLENDETGFAVLTQGAHEYEHLDETKLAFTVVRATGGINSSSTKQWQAPGNQCIRTINGTLALVPFGNGITARNLPNLSLRFRAPLLGFVSCCDTKKFTGGRPCVQDSDLTELFYLPDAYPDACIPSNVSAVTVEGEGITVSALKYAQNKEGQILRLYNTTNQPQCVKVTVNGTVYQTDMAEKNSVLLGENTVSQSIEPKQINTYKIV